MNPNSGRPIESGEARDGKREPWRAWVRPAAVVLLAVLTLLLYAPLLGSNFLNYDDQAYVYENPRVQAGITWEGLRYYSTHVAGGFYAPVMWLSHMAAYEAFGMWAGGHHLVNILIHTGAVLLLLVFFLRTTGEFWASLLVAALFALHPLHVESVAWVSERKDVLSGLFFALTLLAYASYARKPGLWRYTLVAGSFLLGLMSKSMLVTMPFLLLLLDYWPLGRTPAPLAAIPGRWPELPEGLAPRRGWGALLLEKVPLLVLSGIFSYLTTLDQPIIDFVRLPLNSRLLNVAISYGQYTLDTFFPYHLAIYYPLDIHGLSFGRAVAWGLPVVLLVVGAVVGGRRFPYLPVGMLWYVGLLVPVSGIIQIASAARADRYTYLTIIGLFIAVAWGLGDLLSVWSRWRKAILAILLFWLLGLTAAAAFQVRIWQDNESLWTHTYSVTRNNARAARFMGFYALERGNAAQAIPYYQEALRLTPDFQKALLELSHAYTLAGRLPPAARALLTLLRMDSQNPQWGSFFLDACKRLPDPAEEKRYLVEGSALQPKNIEIRMELGRVLVVLGEAKQAVQVLTEALALKPEDPLGNCYLAHALFAAGEERKAAATYRHVLEREPHNPDALAGLAWVCIAAKDPALRDSRAALSMAEEAFRAGDATNPYYRVVLDAARGAASPGGGPK